MPRQPKASPTRPTFQREQELINLGYSRIAGVDEAGRGPLAGPVVAAAVVLPFDFNSPHFEHLNDSKQLKPEIRTHLHADLTQSIAFGVGIVDAPTIDTINIRQASWRAMQLAVAQLQQCLQQRTAMGEQAWDIDYVLIDGFPYGAGPWPYEAIVKGDGRSLSIAAASVIAKVTRDRMMEEYDQEYPQYGFARHKGYPCPQHLAALKQHGPCVLHRRSYAPVRQVCEMMAAAEVTL